MAGRHPRPALDRALNLIEKDKKSGCWLWLARVSSTGCPLIWSQTRGCDVSTARLFYEKHKEEIPKGMRLWHQCGNRRCVNPDHMVPLAAYMTLTKSLRSPSVQNTLKTHCPKGHPYSGDNLKFDKTGKNRLCRACRNERSRIAMRAKYVPVSERKESTEDS